MTGPDHSASEQVVLVSADGKMLGVGLKSEVHGSNTPLHLAFSCHIFSPDGSVLLTRRALSKRAFPGVWSNACCGHPSPEEDAFAAVNRRVGEELGVTLATLRLALPEYRYTAVDSAGVMENEICPVFIGTVTSTQVEPNPAEIEDHYWASWASIASVAKETPRLLSPWAAEQIRSLPSWMPESAGQEQKPARCQGD